MSSWWFGRFEPPWTICIELSLPHKLSNQHWHDGDNLLQITTISHTGILVQSTANRDMLFFYMKVIHINEMTIVFFLIIVPVVVLK